MKRGKIFTIILTAVVLLAFTVISGCTSSKTSIIASPVGTPATAAADLTAGLFDNVSYSIEVVGGTHAPLMLSYADLKSLGLAEKSNVTYVGADGLDSTGDFVGIPMDAILNKAGLPGGNLTYNVSADDGEYMIYTQAQADKAILGIKQDGTALTGNISDDPIHMVLPGGPYCHWIDLPTRIEIISDSPAGYCVPYTSSDSMNMNNSSMG